jgi:hypothetical protein
MNKIFLILILLAFSAVYSQQLRVAVMPTLDNLDSISHSDLDFLTGKLREIAGKSLPSNRYGIMTQESIVARMGSQERAEQECREASCLADLGKKVQAHYVAQGRIGRFGGNLTLKVELYNSETGNLIGSFAEVSPNLFTLVNILDKNAEGMFKRILEEMPIVDDYENFSTGTRWATWGLNLLPGGLGSIVFMDDWAGAIVQWATWGVYFAMYMAGGGPNALYERDEDDEIIGYSTYGSVAMAFGMVGMVHNIYRSIAYDKPRPKTESNAGAFNMMILPTRNGSGMAYGVRYSAGF